VGEVAEPEPLGGVRILVVGASSGIGRAVVEQACRAGATVAAAARRADRLAELAAVTGCRVGTIDVVDGPETAAAVNAMIDDLGGLDVIVVSSGVSPLRPIADTTSRDWRDTFAVNVTGPNVVLRAAVPRLSPDGLALVISSDAVGSPRAGLAAYNASKAALDESLRSWRLEHPDLRLVRLSVGPTMGTEIARDMDPALGMELFPSWIAHGQMPAQMMDVAEVAAHILGLVSTGLANPGVVCEQILLRPRGALMTATASMVSYVEQSQEGSPLSL
jgi:NAD(P)-dependent dehydrogenase (short-subunit alcohol dehydrogenase family)